MYIWLLIICHIAVATTATGHILLRKDDVRSAIGWIGVVWFSPFVGAAIYGTFGINRVARRASQINRGIVSPSGSKRSAVSHVSELGESINMLAQVGLEVSGNRLTAGNTIKALEGGNEAYPQMLKAISAAHHSIVLATYIFRPDSVGTRFVDALVEAQGRGVQVRVLVDGIGSGYFFRLL